MHLQYLLPLRQLILELTDYAPDSEEWEQCLQRIAHRILILRRFCRGDFPECQMLYEVIKAYLTLNLGTQFHDGEALQMLIKSLSLHLDDTQWMKNQEAQNRLHKWATGLREQAFKAVIVTQPNRQEKLTWIDKLAIMTKKTNQGSQERQEALQEIYFAIMIWGKFYRPSSSSSLQYKQQYLDAINVTWLYFCDKGLDQWQPEQSHFSSWFSQQLKWKLGNLYQRMGRDIPQDPFTLPEDEDGLLSKIASLSVEDGETCVECIIRVLGDRLKEKHMQNKPDANLLQMIILLTRCNSWREIGEELGVSQYAARKFFKYNIPPFEDDLWNLLKGL
jgi:hypothetical protein